MNYNLKPLINISVVAVAIFIAFMVTEISHISNTATTTNTVSFSGEGKVTAKPDIAVISASVLTQAATSQTAQNQNTQKSNSVTDFLKNQGIADKDIKTSGYNVYPQYGSTRPCPVSGSGMMYPCSVNQQIITSYQVSQSFEIKIRDLTKVGAILAGLATAGANQVNNLGLKIENPEALQNQARQLAIDNAKKKATDLEKQVGISLGKIVNFSEGANGTIYYDAKVMSAGVGGGAPTPPDISPGENDIVVDVNITYQIK